MLIEKMVGDVNWGLWGDKVVTRCFVGLTRGKGVSGLVLGEGVSLCEGKRRCLFGKSFFIGKKGL